MKKYKAKKIRRMQGNKQGNVVGLSMFGGSVGTVNRRVKYVFQDTGATNDKVQRQEDRN